MWDVGKWLQSSLHGILAPVPVELFILPSDWSVGCTAACACLSSLMNSIQGLAHAGLKFALPAKGYTDLCLPLRLPTLVLGHFTEGTVLCLVAKPLLGDEGD